MKLYKNKEKRPFYYIKNHYEKKKLIMDLLRDITEDLIIKNIIKGDSKG